MYPAGNLFLPAEHGRLEAILKPPRETSPKGAALVLHPHPLGGGTMHNKVTFRAAAALNEAGLVTLRINFRGVGQSTGLHDAGVGEMADARTGLDYLAQNFQNQPIVLCGFSFGARVGMEVGVHDPRADYLISIGSPVNKMDFEFLKECRKPILFVHGERDEFGNVESVRALASATSHYADVKLVVIPESGHFFEGHLDQLKEEIITWINEKLGD